MFGPIEWDGLSGRIAEAVPMAVHISRFDQPLLENKAAFVRPPDEAGVTSRSTISAEQDWDFPSEHGFG